jgi:hypothetical protein
MNIQESNTGFLLDTILQYKDNFKIVYDNQFQEQLSIINNFENFIKKNPNCLSRDNTSGHITGSACVVDKYFSKVLFTYHAKLKKWLQLGGHADGEKIIQNVALNEALEESGLNNFKFVDIINFPFCFENEFYKYALPFDLDIHLIPERKNEAEHFHFDVRFILVTQEENFKISAESLDLKWIDLNEVENYTTEASTLRQVEKLKFLKNKIKNKFY